MDSFTKWNICYLYLCNLPYYFRNFRISFKGFIISLEIEKLIFYLLCVKEPQISLNDFKVQMDLSREKQSVKIIFYAMQILFTFFSSISGELRNSPEIILLQQPSIIF